MIEHANDVNDIIDRVDELNPIVFVEFVRILVQRMAGLYIEALNKYKSRLTSDVV